MPAIRLFDPSLSTGGQAADVIAQYLSHMDVRAEAGLIQPEAAYRARHYCTSFAADFGALDLADCRRGDLTRWLARYTNPHTLHDAAGAVVAAFKWAVDERLIDRSPYKKPRLPTPQPREASRPEEIRAVLQQARTSRGKTAVRFRLALWFLAEVGCRTCELYRLRWEMYDHARGVFELSSKTTRKTGRRRLLVLPTRAWRCLGFLLRWSSTGPVFPNGRGRPWTRRTFARLFRAHADAVGVRRVVKPYSTRHGFCVAKLEAGAGERQLADLMGHSSTRYVAYYGRGARDKIEYLRREADRR